MNQPLTVHAFSDPAAPGLSTLPNGSVVLGPPAWGGYYAGTYDWEGNWSAAQVPVGSGGRWAPEEGRLETLPC